MHVCCHCTHTVVITFFLGLLGCEKEEEKEEEEGLFKADAVNEEDPGRRRMRRRRKVYSKLTQLTRRTPSAIALPRCRRLVPPCYVPDGDSPLSLYATVLSSKVVLASVSRHRLEESGQVDR